MSRTPKTVKKAAQALPNWSTVVVNELLVRQHLPAACELVREAVHGRG